MSTEVLPFQADSVAVVKRSDALAPDLAVLIERVLLDPNADVSKLSALLDVNERIVNRAAKAAFDSAYAQMQPELPEIDEKGIIKQKDQVTIKSRYAKYEDIQSAVRPVLSRFGFSMRHRVEWPEDKAVIRVVGILSHREGHSEESRFEAPPDKNDYRTAIQDQGSTVSYGKRYTTCDLLNIITRGQDNDGQPAKAEAPKGYDIWWTALEGTATAGFKELEATFFRSPKEFKEHTLNHNKQAWAALKQQASTVKAGGK